MMKRNLMMKRNNENVDKVMGIGCWVKKTSNPILM